MKALLRNLLWILLFAIGIISATFGLHYIGGIAIPLLFKCDACSDLPVGIVWFVGAIIIVSITAIVLVVADCVNKILEIK